MTELWNWRLDDRVVPARIYAALAEVLDRPVLPLASADPPRLPPGGLLCDVWHRPGDFPTSVDSYGSLPVDDLTGPPRFAESTAAAAFARRLRRRCLIPDDTLDPGRHLLISPDGTMRPVHLDVRETDEGEVLSNWRLCSTSSACCRGWSPCHQSRWAPDSVIPALAVA
jgi:hypothetical protein